MNAVNSCTSIRTRTRNYIANKRQSVLLITQFGSLLVYFPNKTLKWLPQLLVIKIRFVYLISKCSSLRHLMILECSQQVPYTAKFSQQTCAKYSKIFRNRLNNQRKWFLTLLDEPLRIIRNMLNNQRKWFLTFLVEPLRIPLRTRIKQKLQLNIPQ